MSDATLGGVEVPVLQVQETARRHIGGSIARAVDGTPHSSPVRSIREWRLETGPITHAAYEALRGVDSLAAGGQVLFQSVELEAPVYVYIREFLGSRTRVPDTEPGKTLWTVRVTLEEA